MNPWPVEAEVAEVHLPRRATRTWRASRSTASRTRATCWSAPPRARRRVGAGGAPAKAFLRVLGGGAPARHAHRHRLSAPERDDLGPEDFEGVDESPVRCLDVAASAMVAEIDAARKANESLGGVFQVLAFGLVPGIGCTSPGRNGSTAARGAVMSIQAMAAPGSATASALAERVGSLAHDEIFFSRSAATSGRRTAPAGSRAA